MPSPFSLIPLVALIGLSSAAPFGLSTRAGLSCPASNSGSFTANGKKYTIECGTDRYGGDMPSPNGAYVGTFEACISSCASRDGCTNVNYVPSSTACFLKNVQTGAKSSDSVWGALLNTGTTSAHSATPSDKQVTPPQGGKRGIAFNNAAFTNLFTGSKFGWDYNWDSQQSGANSRFEFVPLLHDDSAQHTTNWAANVDKAVSSGSTHVMSFNEPDQCGGGGACMQDVGRTIASFKKYMQPLASSHPSLKIGAPAVTNGVKDSATGSAMGLPWLKSFLAGCDGCKIDFICIHWYDSASNTAYFKKQVEDAYTAGGNKPVWITEFAPSGSDDEKAAFLKEVLPWLDANDHVERYAYQMASSGALINAAGNALSGVGNVYAST